jgi:hypothetical protein
MFFNQLTGFGKADLKVRLGDKQGAIADYESSLKDEEEIKQRFPQGYTAVKPYLRLTPQPEQD